MRFTKRRSPLAEGSWPVHAAPRITELTFANALLEGPRVFKGISEVGTVWSMFMKYGVDPSFALGHFWVESNFGTAGWNVWSDPKMYSWGNVLYVNSSLRGQPGVTEYKASNGFEYTAYPDWTTGVEDYCLLLKQYRDQSPDSRYGDTSKIYGATAKWPAKTPGSDGHIQYMDIVLGRMTRYDARPDWKGEMALFTPGTTYNSNKRYAVKAGDRWYLEPGGTTSYAFKADGSAVFLGQVAGTSWLAIRISTARLSNDNVTRFIVGYLPKYDAKRVTTI